MQLKHKIPLHVGGNVIDLTCNLTVVLLTNRYVAKGFFMVCFPFNRKFDPWLNAVQVIVQGLYKARPNCGTYRYIINISFPKPGLDECGGQMSLLQVFHNQVGHSGWHRRAHSCTKDLLVVGIVVLKICCGRENSKRLTMFLTEIAALPILQSVNFREHFGSNMNGKFHSNQSEKNIERNQFVIFFEFDVFHPLAKIQAVLNCEIGFFQSEASGSGPSALIAYMLENWRKRQ